MASCANALANGSTLLEGTSKPVCVCRFHGNLGHHSILLGAARCCFGATLVVPHDKREERQYVLHDIQLRYFFRASYIYNPFGFEHLVFFCGIADGLASMGPTNRILWGLCVCVRYVPLLEFADAFIPEHARYTNCYWDSTGFRFQMKLS